MVDTVPVPPPVPCPRSKSLSSQSYKKKPSAPTSAPTTPSRECVMDLRGSLTAELEEKFKVIQQRLAASESQETAVNGDTLNHRWPPSGKRKLIKQSKVDHSSPVSSTDRKLQSKVNHSSPVSSTDRKLQSPADEVMDVVVDAWKTPMSATAELIETVRG